MLINQINQTTYNIKYLTLRIKLTIVITYIVSNMKCEKQWQILCNLTDTFLNKLNEPNLHIITEYLLSKNVNGLLNPRTEMLKSTPLLRHLLLQKLWKELPASQNWCICGHDPQKVPVYLWPWSKEGIGLFVAMIHRRYRFICGHDTQKVPWHCCYLSQKSNHGASTNWLCTLHRFCNVNNSKPHYNCAQHTKQNRSLPITTCFTDNN